MSLIDFWNHFLSIVDRCPVRSIVAGGGTHIDTLAPFTLAAKSSLNLAWIAWFMKLKQHFKFYYRRNGEQHSINIALELWGCPVGLNEKCTGWNKKGNIRRHISRHHRKWVHNLQCQRKIKNLKNIYKEWKSWCLWHYHGNQSRYVTTGQLWVDIGKISLNTQIWSAHLQRYWEKPGQKIGFEK